MKKQYLKYIFTVILLVILVIPNKSFAITSSGDYTIESYNEYSKRYEFADEGLTAVPVSATGLADDLNFKLCARAIKDIYNEFMETDYE